MLTKLQCCHLYEDCNVHPTLFSTPEPPQPLHASALSQRRWPCVTACTPAAGRQLCRASSNEGASTSAVVCSNAHDQQCREPSRNTCLLTKRLLSSMQCSFVSVYQCGLVAWEKQAALQAEGDAYLAEHAGKQSLRNLAKLSAHAGLLRPRPDQCLGAAHLTGPLRQASADSLDRVSNVFVDTAFRSTPWAQEAAESDSARTTARLLFVSESGVCRSVLAQALLRGALHARGLGDSVECEARGTRRALGQWGFALEQATMRPGAFGC